MSSSRTKRLAAGFSLATGAWGVGLGVYLARFLANGGPAASVSSVYYPIVAVGTILILDSTLCFIGFSSAFYGSAALALLMIAFVPGGIQPSEAFLVSILLVVATIALDLVAATRREYIPEEDHPLNLPVFG